MLALLLLLLLAGARAAPFRAVVIPDSQYDLSGLRVQAQWICREWLAGRVDFVSHVGDVVHHVDSGVEWALAARALWPLVRCGVPFGVAPGNHDSVDATKREPRMRHERFFSWYTELLGREFLAQYHSHTWTGAAWLHATARPDYVWFHVDYQMRFFTDRRPIVRWIAEQLHARPGVRALLTVHDACEPVQQYPNELLEDAFAAGNGSLLAAFGGHFIGNSSRGVCRVYGTRARPHVAITANYQDEMEVRDWLRVYELDDDERLCGWTLSPGRCALHPGEPQPLAIDLRTADELPGAVCATPGLDLELCSASSLARFVLALLGVCACSLIPVAALHRRRVRWHAFARGRLSE
jgi:hypothetical protein